MSVVVRPSGPRTTNIALLTARTARTADPGGSGAGCRAGAPGSGRGIRTRPARPGRPAGPPRSQPRAVPPPDTTPPNSVSTKAISGRPARVRKGSSRQHPKLTSQRPTPCASREMCHSQMGAYCAAGRGNSPGPPDLLRRPGDLDWACRSARRRGAHRHRRADRFRSAVPATVDRGVGRRRVVHRQTPPPRPKRALSQSRPHESVVDKPVETVDSQILLIGLTPPNGTRCHNNCLHRRRGWPRLGGRSLA